MNKFKIRILLSFLLVILSISKVYAIVNSYSLLGKVIYLDAGHGGIDSGAIYGDIKEKDINLILVKKLEEELVKRGAVVYLTRDSDKDLSTTTVGRKRSDLRNRARLINERECDMYISIHLNYITSSKWKGLQIFYNNKHKDNENMAKVITEYLKNEMANVRDYKYNGTYYMYKFINKPGILIEVGFLSNSNDRYRLTRDEYQNDIVIKIANAVERYFIGKY